MGERRQHQGMHHSEEHDLRLLKTAGAFLLLWLTAIGIIVLAVRCST